MKILFSPNDNIIKKSDVKKWNVDDILIPVEYTRDANYQLPTISEALTLFVPTILDHNLALNYDGVEWAIRLYLQCIRNNQFNVLIVLLGVESERSFLLRFQYPNILKCPGFDYIIFHQKSISNYSIDPIDFKRENAINALNSLGIKLPLSYKSSHSFVNEWCAYKWKEYMRQDFSSILNKIQKTLYFDYIRTIQQGKKASIVKEERLNAIKELNGKVLLIDDNLFWHEFFKEFFKDSDVNYSGIGNNFKNLEIEDIIKICEDKIKDFKPDVILLDFRLSEDKDYEVQSAKQISGVEVLRKLKGDNETRGCGFSSRIIMFTATRKMESIFALQEYGADGFIFKELPENYVGKSQTKKSIKDLVSILEEMLRCAPLAKSISECLDNWQDSIYNLDKNHELVKKVNQVELIVNSLMKGNFVKKLKLKLLYLECFSILESLKKDRLGLDEFIKKSYAKDLSVERNSNWDTIDKLRNSLAHGDDYVELNSSSKRIVDDDFISEWLIKLCDFIYGVLIIQTERIRNKN